MDDQAKARQGAELVYTDDLPAPPALFRVARAFPQLLAFPPFRRLLLGRLRHTERCSIAPGFYAVCPEHLHATDANLNDTQFINYAPVTIGRDTRMSGGNLFLTSTHDPADFSVVKARPIIIGDGVWITYRCIILGGVSIGAGSIIGAGSVVTRDIPAGVLAAGNPCKVIRQLSP